MRSPEISIIVPVYQAEKWMRRCLDSIIAQSLADWECILVDDGSTDLSGAVCDDYAARDSRFRVIHKENGGVSSARQTGLDNARGTYVIHADPDDYTHTDWLKSLHGKAIEEDADMTICDILWIPYDGSAPSKFPGCLHHTDPASIIEDMLMGDVPVTCLNKLVRRECFDKYHISFPIGLNYAEDMYISCHLLNNITKVAYVPETLYYYDNTQCDSSLTKIINLQRVTSAKFVIDSIQDILQDKRYDKGLYRSKRKFKELLISMNEKSPYDIQKTYPEINERYLEELKDAKFLSQRYGMALALKGHYTIGHFIFHAAIWAKNKLHFPSN